MMHLKGPGKSYCDTSETFPTVTYEGKLVNCPACLDLMKANQEALKVYEEAEAKKYSGFHGLIRSLSEFGEGTYGELEWVFLGFVTCGIGVLVMAILKPLSKLIMKVWP